MEESDDDLVDRNFREEAKENSKTTVGAVDVADKNRTQNILNTMSLRQSARMQLFEVRVSDK
jgi:hypothetical protein